MAMGCLVWSASAGWWIAERNRGRLEEKVERGFINELRGIPTSHLEAAFLWT